MYTINIKMKNNIVQVLYSYLTLKYNFIKRGVELNLPLRDHEFLVLTFTLPRL